jgi:hypothetical protein
MTAILKMQDGGQDVRTDRQVTGGWSVVPLPDKFVGLTAF